MSKKEQVAQETAQDQPWTTFRLPKSVGRSRESGELIPAVGDVYKNVNGTEMVAVTLPAGIRNDGRDLSFHKMNVTPGMVREANSQEIAVSFPPNFDEIQLSKDDYVYGKWETTTVDVKVADLREAVIRASNAKAKVAKAPSLEEVREETSKAVKSQANEGKAKAKAAPEKAAEK